jgi:DNA-binding transcriptional LysR family regulator
MSTNRVNLLHLEQFYEIAKAGSVSTGARKLRISQPALSKAIRLLEEALEAKLFERTKRGVHLTGAGQIAFEHAGKIFSETTRLRERIESEKGVISGEWSLGASDNLAIHLLPPILTKMKSDHPDLRIQIFAGPSSDIKDELYSDRCDAGLFFTPPLSTEPLRSEIVFETEFWIVISKRSPWVKKGRSLTLADLKNQSVPRIESRHKDYSNGFPAHFHSKKLNLTDAPYIEANLHEIKKRFVMEGLGYAFLVKHAVEREVESGEFIRIPTPTRLSAPIYWVTRKGRPPSRASEEFRDRLIARSKSPQVISRG